MFSIESIRHYFVRFERQISSFSLLLGFIFDAFTLKRVDTLWENVWILGYLFLIGVFIILIHLKENEGTGEDSSESHFWYVNILQFCFGGVFSAYLVLYFRSADILVAWPFIALLAIIFIANEFLKQHYIRLSFQISLFFLSIYWFAIFLVPVLVHKIGTSIFLLSGLVSLLIITFFIKILFYFIRDKFEKSKRLLIFLIASIFFIVNFLYFTNLIPPIPLSLKDAGAFHAIQKTEEGNYIVAYEDRKWNEYFKLYQDFKQTQRSSLVYAYSAIFSPRGLNLTILHEWQHYDTEQERWTTERVISLKVVGGRDEGFRTFSVRSNLAKGRWRVNIKTEQGLIIGRLRFNLVPSEIEPELKTEMK